MKIIVLYDGKCGVCSKEVALYMRLSSVEKFIWEDINLIDSIQKYKIETKAALNYLHIIKDEKILIGVDAFIQIWQEIKYFRLLSFFIRLPLIYSLAKYSYSIFAEYRFKRLSHCQILEKEKS